MLKPAAALLLVLLAAPASAQMDWLGPHLDSQRWNRLREQQMRGQSPAGRQAPDRVPSRPRMQPTRAFSEHQSPGIGAGPGPRQRP